MAKVPIYTPSATLKPVSGPRATADVFGGIAAAQDAEVAKAGFSIAQGMQEIQEKRDSTHVLGAEASLKEQILAKQRDFEARLGINAEGVTAEARKAWDDLYRQHEDSLGNRRQKAMFRARMADTRLAFGDTVSQHETKQTRVAVADAAKANIGASIQFAAANVTHPDAIAVAKHDITRQGEFVGLTNGWAPEVTKAFIAKNVDGMHQQVLQNLVRMDPSAAREYFKANKKEIDPASYDTVDKMIDDAGNKAVAQAIGDTMVKYESEEQHLEAVRKDKKLTPDARSEAEAEVKARWAERRRIQTEIEDRAMSDALKALEENGGRITALDPALLARLRGDQRIALNQTAAALVQGGETNEYERYLDLSDLALNNPAEFRKRFKNEYLMLTPGHRSKLEGFLNPQTPGYLTAQTTEQIINSGTGEIWGGTLSTSEKEDKAKFKDIVYERINSAQAAQKRELTSDEKRAIVRQLATEVVIDRGKVWNTERYIYELTDKEIATAEPGEKKVGTVPNRQEIIDYLRANGGEVTENNINELYRGYLRRMRDGR